MLLSSFLYSIHCHPRGTGNGICCNKSSGVDAGGGEGANWTAEHQEEKSQDNDSKVDMVFLTGLES